jgi:hypothetical protein
VRDERRRRLVLRLITTTLPEPANGREGTALSVSLTNGPSTDPLHGRLTRPFRINAIVGNNMLVPRSFKYSCPPPTTPVIEQRQALRNNSRDKPPATPEPRQRPRAAESRSRTPPPTTAEMMRKPSRPVDVPSPEKARFPGSKTSGHTKGRSTGGGKRKEHMPAQHRSDALPPSVAALLAMTTIPRRPRQTQRRSGSKRQVSIDELVNEWKSEDGLVKSYESSPLSILLESADDSEDARSSSLQSDLCHRSSYERSDSSDSVPSLEGDAHSMFSLSSPATPGSMRSRKFSMITRKESPRVLPIRECCAEDHPLISLSCDEDDAFDFSPPHRDASNASKSSFKSNLTTSLQALKLAALSPFTPRKNASAPALRTRRSANKAERAIVVSPLSDDVLWSHPFLFPRFSHEVRPEYNGTPTTAQRRYLNPIPLSFEEQEAPFQQALHAPYLAEQPGMENAPTIQMQTYSRSGGRHGKGRNAGSKTDADAEANGAVVNAAVAAAMRQREPRENSDFLRVVVLEMNMRREGKLEMGRAKIWLPPRQSTEVDAAVQGKVPRRWVGESA